MSKGLLSIWQPTLTFVRYRKINIQKPFPPHFTRAVVEHVCKPILPISKKKDPKTPLDEICTGSGPYFKKEEIDNPYVNLLAKEILNFFNNSRLIAFFHKNPTNSDEMYDARLSLKKKLGMLMKINGRGVMAKAVAGTKYEAILSLYQSDTVVAFGPNPDVVGLLKVTKKMPKFTLLAAVVEDRLMSRAELDRINTLGDIQAARAGLVAVLNQQSQQVVSNITQHQAQLVNHLDQHIQLQSKTD